MGQIQDAYTLSQAIKYHGREFTVTRPTLNKFKEPAGEEPVGSFRGLFHVSSGYLDISLTEAAKVSTRKQPQLLLLYDSFRPVAQIFLHGFAAEADDDDVSCLVKLRSRGC